MYEFASLFSISQSCKNCGQGKSHLFHFSHFVVNQQVTKKQTNCFSLWGAMRHVDCVYNRPMKQLRFRNQNEATSPQKQKTLTKGENQ
jgi:hypothetical protein